MKSAPLLEGAITPTERDTPEIRRALRVRFRRANMFTVPSAVPTVVLMCAVLWNQTSRVGLVLWGALCITQLMVAWHLHWRRPIEEGWEARAAVAQAVGGISWGLIPILAMPDETQWQVFLGALILGVLASNALFGSVLRGAFYAFLVPVAGLSATGFMLLGTGTGRWMTGGLVLYGAVFSSLLAHISRNDDEEAAALAHRNALLANELAVESKRLQSANLKLALQATHDSLTGLANRDHFMTHLRDLLRANKGRDRIAVLFLDLDQFKHINDSHGHGVGDDLLKTVAERLTGVVGPSELLGRMGGDELTAIIHCPEGADPAVIARRFLDAFAAPFSIDGRSFNVGASIGVAVEDGVSSPSDLLRFADTALYRAKDRGRGRLEVFDRAMRLELDHRSGLADELHNAVISGHLTTHLQPIVDMADGTIQGAEALSRWPHPSGLRTAGSYIELASELGLELHISRQAVDAVNDFRLLSLPQEGAPWITVNVPPQQIGEMFRHFAASPYELDGLTLEITETAAVHDLDMARELLDAARQAGARVLLDDFGVGQSSLSLLTDLPLDGVKIDAAFVRQLTSSESARAVVSAIVELGRRMDLMVIAEGIETFEQAELLQELGVRLAQGYLYSAAMPFGAFTALLESGRTLGPARIESLERGDA